MANETKRGGKGSPAKPNPMGRQRQAPSKPGASTGNTRGGFKPAGAGRPQSGQSSRTSKPAFGQPKETAWRAPRQKPGISNQPKEGFRTDSSRPARPGRGRPFTDNRFPGKSVSPGEASRSQGIQASPASLRFGPGSRPSQDRPAAQQRFFRQFGTAPGGAVAEPTLPAASLPQEYQEETVSDILLTGRNPIREAIKTGRDLEKLMISKGELSGSAREIVSLAKKAGVMIQSVERTRLDQLAKNHQGMIAFASAYSYSSVEEIMQAAKDAGEEPFIILLDQVTDPHNLGAIIRTASCAGAHGVIVPMHRAAGLTPAAVKASAGAVEHIKVARVTNLNQAIKSLQSQGVWFYAAEPEGEDYRKVSFSGPCALVIGSEGEGVSPLTASLCDKTVSIPMSGPISSLNASVAAGVLMFAVHGARHPA